MINVISVFALILGLSGFAILCHAKTLYRDFRMNASAILFKGGVMLILSLSWFICVWL